MPNQVLASIPTHPQQVSKPREWAEVGRVLDDSPGGQEDQPQDQLAIVVRHDDFVGTDKEPQELYAVKKHFSIQVEGDPDFFFDVSMVQEDREEEPVQQQVLPTVVDDKLMGQNHGGQNNLVVALTGLIDVDDDNEPVPENIPVHTAPPPPSVLSQEWGHEGFCLRKSNNILHAKPKLVYPVDTTRNDVSLQLFERFFPRAFMEDIMIAETNKILDQHPLSYGELLHWISLWVSFLWLMDLTTGPFG